MILKWTIQHNEYFKYILILILLYLNVGLLLIFTPWYCYWSRRAEYFFYLCRQGNKKVCNIVIQKTHC